MSTGTTGAIKGGKAFVEAWLDDGPFMKGLASLSTKLKTWQTSLAKIGAGAYGGELPEPFAAIVRFAASPAGAFSALLGAAKYTADAREEMLRMSETTGVAVDKLSALSYAARRAGVSNEALANGLRKLQSKEFAEMMQGPGGKGKLKFASALVLDHSSDAADQFRQIVSQFEKLDSVSRVGLAKKLGITELLPLINQGVASLDAFTARAHALGLVVNEEDARAGKQFELALGDLHEVLMSSVKAIGGALVPVITGLADTLIKVAVSVRDWIRDHKTLTQVIFLATGFVVGAGIAIKGFSVIIGIATKVIGLFRFALTALSTAFSVFSTVLAWLPLLANPFVLAGIAIVAMTGFVLYLLDAFKGLGKLLKSIGSDFGVGIEAIINAISGGNTEAAFKVLTAGLKLEWERLCEWMAERFQKVVSEAASKYALLVPGMEALDMYNQLTSSKGPNDRLTRLQDEFNQAVAAVKAVKSGPGLGLGTGGDKAFAGAAASEHRGTFNGAIAGMLGGDTPGLTIAKSDYQNSLRWRAEAASQHKETVEAIKETPEDFRKLIADHTGGVD